MLKPVKNISAVNDKHVKIELSEPYAASLGAFRLRCEHRPSKKPMRRASKFGTSPMRRSLHGGTLERASDRSIESKSKLLGHGADGKPLPYLDGVELKYVPESNSRVLGLRNGDYDVIRQLPSTKPSLSRPIATCC